MNSKNDEDDRKHTQHNENTHASYHNNKKIDGVDDAGPLMPEPKSLASSHTVDTFGTRLCFSTGVTCVSDSSCSSRLLILGRCFLLRPRQHGQHDWPPVSRLLIHLHNTSGFHQPDAIRTTTSNDQFIPQPTAIYVA